jgi:hypothetical protein
LRLLTGLVGIPILLSALVLGSLSGCSAGSAAIDEAYARGYADGLASVEEELIAAEQAYQLGYQDGLDDAEEVYNAELCQSCYGLGFREGYQVGAASSGTG